MMSAIARKRAEAEYWRLQGRLHLQLAVGAADPALIQLYGDLARGARDLALAIDKEAGRWEEAAKASREWAARRGS